MTDQLRFPLYVFRAAGNAADVFNEHDGEKHLPLFTSAEHASMYRKLGSLEVQIVRLKTPRDLRSELLSHREAMGEYKILVDPEIGVSSR